MEKGVARSTRARLIMLSSPAYNVRFLPPQIVILPVEGVADKAILEFHPVKIISLAVHYQTLAIGLLDNLKTTKKLEEPVIVRLGTRRVDSQT